MANSTDEQAKLQLDCRSGFGSMLKEWRALRRLSQLDLSLAAGVSARHVAFLETGRTRPSREMVIALAAAMDVPLQSRNHLMQEAGFAAIYKARPLGDVALIPVRNALDLMLDNHNPYPGILLDRHWNLLEANAAAVRLFGPLLGQSTESNLVRRLLDNPSTPDLVRNWGQVAHSWLARLRLEATQAGADIELDALVALLAAEVQRHSCEALHDATGHPFIDFKLTSGGHEIALFSAMVEFATASDITVRDLRLELFFPANDASAKGLQNTGAAPT